MLPTLQQLETQFKDNKKVTFKKETVAGSEFTIVFYQISDNDFWKEPFSTECRGHVFDHTGKCVVAALEKFFNLNELNNNSGITNNIDILFARALESYKRKEINDETFNKLKQEYYAKKVSN